MRMRMFVLTGLLLGVAAMALAEDITMTTFYPSPRGVYNQLRTMGETTLAETSGNVGIGTTAPVSKLDVSGGVKFGNETTCNFAHEGTQRYNAALQVMEFCNGTVWVPVGGSAIKSIQRGTISMPQGGATSVSATITSVDVTKALVVSGGCTSDTASTSPHDWLVRMELSSATTVTATRVYSGDGNILCTYQVVEYL